MFAETDFHNPGSGAAVGLSAPRFVLPAHDLFK
jgi:hypothetical protein